MSGVEFVVGGWLASASIRKFVDAAGGYLSSNYGLHKETKELLDKLKNTLPEMQAIMEEAEKQQIQNKGLIEWAKLIKDAAYEAEDVLDDFATKSISEDLKGKSKASKAASSMAQGAKNLIFLDDDVKKLKAIVKKLEGLCQQSNTFIGMLKFDSNHKQKGPANTKSGEPTQILPLDKIVGRDNEMKFILSMIMGYEIELPECDTSSRDNKGNAGPSNTSDMGTKVGKIEQITSNQKEEMRLGSKSSNIETSHYGRPHVIPIVGICGVGKTFLAHAIYKHKLLEGRFHLKRWFYMSQISDVDNMLKALIPSFESSDPDDLSKQLDRKMMGTRFFIVLDDVHSDVFNLDQLPNKKSLVDVLSRLNVGAYGSVILVTTREKNVPMLLGINDPIILNPLEWNYFLPLLEYYAFQNVSIAREKRPAIEKICYIVGRKLHGIPQAAKMIGNMIRLKIDDYKYWYNILNNSKFRHENIFSFLEVAYQQLYGNLKQCIVFCSAFPKNYIVEKDRLIQLWIANNFVPLNSADGVKSEDTGEMWFNELVNFSFFLPTPWPHWYILNSAMRELAEGISSNDFFIFDDNPIPNSCLHGCFLRKDDHNPCTHGYSVIDNGPKKIPPYIRYLTVRTTEPTIDLGSCSDNLHTLFFQSDYYESNEQKKGWFDQFIRIMKKDNHKQITSSSFLRSTSKLRALELSCLDDGVGQQLYSICQLSHLRFLDLSFSGIRELPETICTLYHLQVLDIRGCKLEELPLDEKINKLPKKLNQLINLRHLYMGKETIFLISSIGKLTYLQELKEFKITKEKGHTISELTEMNEIGGHLSIVGLDHVKDEVEAGEARLSEKQYLKVLSLIWYENCSENKNPKDNMEKAGKILNSLQPHSAVEELEIVNYPGATLPSWIHPSILNFRRIYLKKCHRLIYLPPLGSLPFLETLVLQDLNLERIGKESYGPGMSIFPMLKVLKFVNMWKWEIWSPPGERELLPRLEELEIRDCYNLEKTPLQSLNLLCLKTLQLSRCNGVFEKGSLFDKQLPQLSSLYISYNPRITLAYQNIPNLRFLSLHCSNACFSGDRPDLSNLKSLILEDSSVNWDRQPDVSSLTKLKMSGPYIYNIIQSHLPSLRILEIRAYGPGTPESLYMLLLKLPHLIELTLTFEGVPNHAGFTLASLVSLKSLTIHFESPKSRGIVYQICPQITIYPLRSVPEMPPNLKELYIVNMPEELMQRCIPDEGEDWHKIAHIPYIRVNGTTLQML